MVVFFTRVECVRRRVMRSISGDSSVLVGSEKTGCF